MKYKRKKSKYQTYSSSVNKREKRLNAGKICSSVVIAIFFLFMATRAGFFGVSKIKQTLKFWACLISPISFDFSKSDLVFEFTTRPPGVLSFETAFFARDGPAPLLESCISRDFDRPSPWKPCNYCVV